MEELECYIAYFFRTETDGTEEDTCSQVQIQGVSINGTKYTFSTTFDLQTGFTGTYAAFSDYINSEFSNIGFGGILSDLCCYVENDTGAGTTYALRFSSFPSLISDMFFLGGCYNEVGSADVNVGLPIAFQVLLYADRTTGILDCGECPSTVAI